MPQPSLENLFGIDAQKEGNRINISRGALEAAGITDYDNAQPIELFAALNKISSEWLETNTDQAVLASSSSYVSAPSSRNGVDKTQFNITYAFYGSYSAPTLNPEDL